MNYVFVGATAALRFPATIMDGVTPPQPPGSYTKPESIAKWHDENDARERSRFATDAAWHRPTGTLSRVVAMIMRADGSAAYFDSVTVPDGDLPDALRPPGVKFLSWLLHYIPSQAFTWHPSPGVPRPLNVYGFRADEVIRLAAFDGIYAGLDVPIGLWYGNPCCYDPLAMIIPAELKGKFGLRKVLAEAPKGSIEFPKSRTGLSVETFAPGLEPELDLALTLELCARYQLCPNATENHQKYLDLEHFTRAASGVESGG